MFLCRCARLSAILSAILLEIPAAKTACRDRSADLRMRIQSTARFPRRSILSLHRRGSRRRREEFLPRLGANPGALFPGGATRWIRVRPGCGQSRPVFFLPRSTFSGAGHGGARDCRARFAARWKTVADISGDEDRRLARLTPRAIL